MQGVCLYPMIDRPDWNNPSHWHHAGLWDVPQGGEPFDRLCEDYAQALTHWQGPR